MSEANDGAEFAADLALEALGESDLNDDNWRRKVAASTLVFASVAAVAALLSGITSHEILVTRTEEIVDFSLSEGDRIAAAVLDTKHDLQQVMGVEPDAEEVAAVEGFLAEAELLREEARHLELESQQVGRSHLIFAMSAAIAAIGIAVIGLSVVVDRRWLWVTGTIAGGLAAAMLVLEGVAWFLV